MTKNKKLTTQNVASYTVFYQENKPIMNSKYPFLSADQINCRLRDQWKKLEKQDKKNFTIPKICTTPSAKGCIKKKIGPKTQVKTPKALFTQFTESLLQEVMVSKDLKQKSVADWLQGHNQKDQSTKTYSSASKLTKGPEILDRTPHLKTGILKNSDRSLSLERSKSEGRTPLQVKFNSVKQESQEDINNNISNTVTDANHNFMKPKNLNTKFDLNTKAEMYVSDFDDPQPNMADNDSGDIDLEDYSDSDNDNLLYYNQEEVNDSQQTEDSPTKTSTNNNSKVKELDQTSTAESENNEPLKSVVSKVTVKSPKAPKPFKNGTITPSQSTRTLRHRKPIQSQEDNLVESPSFEKGISPKLFGLPKKRPRSITNSDKMDLKKTLRNHDKFEMVNEINKNVNKSSKHIPKTTKLVDISGITNQGEKRWKNIKPQSNKPKYSPDDFNSSDTPESGYKSAKTCTDEDENEKVSGSVCAVSSKSSKRRSRNQKPKYTDDADFNESGNAVSKKKLNVKLLPGLFDDCDIEMTSKEECIKQQDKLIRDFPLFQKSEDEVSESQNKTPKDHEYGYYAEQDQSNNKTKISGKKAAKKLEKEAKLQANSAAPQNELGQMLDKENLNKNSNNISILHINDTLRNINQDIMNINQDIMNIDEDVIMNIDEDVISNTGSQDIMDINDDSTSIFAVKSFAKAIKFSKFEKPDSFSSCYDDNDDDDDNIEIDGLNKSELMENTGTLQKILSSLRQIGSQQSTEAEDESSEDESPKLLSPTLSGVSALSSLSELSKQSGSSKDSKKQTEVPVSDTAVVPVSDTAVVPVSDTAVVPVSNTAEKLDICEMFQDISSQDKKTKKKKSRRLAASNREVGISNFGVLFEEEDIFF